MIVCSKLGAVLKRMSAAADSVLIFIILFEDGWILFYVQFIVCKEFGLSSKS